MNSLEPLINLIIVLTVLSVAAERFTNLLKLEHPDLREKGASEKEREHRITWLSLLVGIGLALLMKANMFELLTQLDAPWDTLGWVRVTDGGWARVPATQQLGTALYAAGGSVITGLALGFGSKFWHELLDAVLEVRGMAKSLRKKAENNA